MPAPFRDAAFDIFAAGPSRLGTSTGILTVVGADGIVFDGGTVGILARYLAPIAGEAIPAGAPVAVKDVSGTPKSFKCGAAATWPLPNFVGINSAAVAIGEQPLLMTMPVEEIDVPDAIWDAVPAAARAGYTIFVSETAGKLCFDVSGFASGSYVIPAARLMRGGAGLCRALPGASEYSRIA